MDEDDGEVEPMPEPDSTVPDESQKAGKVNRGSKASRTSKTSKSSEDGKGKRDGSLADGHQQLFLVEFLVDTVTIDSCAVDEEILEGQTCLTLSFLNFPPLEICEKDFDSNKESALDKVRFNCGKSLMFAFNENQCDHPPPLSVEITVSKKLGQDKNPFKVDIGTIKICVSELFRQIVDIAKFKPEKLPASKSIKDCFMLIGPGKRTMGEVSVYIRLSCLGQNVVTEFQCGPDLKANPVLFKNREGKKIFEFTGNESRSEDVMTTATALKGKIGCGCIRPNAPHNENFRGGQGDTEKSSPSAEGAYAKGNKVVLNVPEKNSRYSEPNKGDFKSKPLVNMESPKGGVAVSKVTSNPDQNVFILKVGDKGQIPDRGKMILEFRTPKQKILPKMLPPYHEDIAVQTDSPKKGKGKGKKK